jgi:hypothetical protein
MANFPVHPDDVTPAWITDGLHAAGALRAGSNVIGFDRQPVGEGVGMLGVIARLTLHLDHPDSDAPATVVVKCATPSMANREVAKAFRVYEREVRFFSELADRVQSGIPRCYAAEFNDETHDFILVLDDVGHYRQGDQVAGCGLADAQAGVDAMAALHAAWWDAPKHPELAWVPAVNSELHLNGMTGGFDAGWDPFMAAFGSSVDLSIVAARDAYRGGLPGLHDRMASGTQTLVHGDFRLDNLMFGDGQPGTEPMSLLDWQGMLTSKGPHDLGYFLTQNVTTDVRRAHERDLVARYHAALVAHGVTGYSADDAWADYELAALYLFEYAVVIGGTLDPANARGSAFMTGLIARSSQTIVDLDLLRLLD